MVNKQHGTILVVDDQQNWRDLLVNILKEDGHEVVTTSNLQEAKTLLNIRCFDIATIDMRLVNSDEYNIQGMEVLREAKKQHPAMKAIILTGYPDNEQRNKAIERYHADGYFEKVPDGEPLDIDKFSQLISELLKG